MYQQPKGLSPASPAGETRAAGATGRPIGMKGGPCMKKLLGLVAVALIMSFATVSVAWAGPAQNHDQQNRQGKEVQRKTAKQPSGVKHHKAPGAGGVKAPPAHSRGEFKQNRQDRHPAKISGHKPANHGRDQVKSNNRQPQGPDRIGAKKPAGNNHHIKRNDGHTVKNHDKNGPPANHDRHDAIKRNNRHAPKNHDGIRTPANHGRHDAIRHERPQPRPHTVHRDRPSGRSDIHRYHSRHQQWPDGDDWHRHFRDWSWFTTHHVRDIGACYADNRRDRALYIHFEPQDDDYLYLLESRYGHSTYRERYHRHGYDGWCHYWFRGDNIIALFVGDGGYNQAFVWRRDEVESHSLSLGILTPDLQIVYSSYDADMPPDLAAGYTREVLWATVDN